jgi:hypothetical protein
MRDHAYPDHALIGKSDRVAASSAHFANSGSGQPRPSWLLRIGLWRSSTLTWSSALLTGRFST